MERRGRKKKKGQGKTLSLEKGETYREESDQREGRGEEQGEKGVGIGERVDKRGKGKRKVKRKDREKA